MSNLIDSLAEKFGADHRRMAQALDKAMAEIDRLRLDNANLQAENRHLRRLLKDHELRLLRRAERDALLIGALHYSGSATSKRVCATVGMGENRWCLARALLRYGGGLRRDGSIKPGSSDAYIACVQRGIALVEDVGGDVLKRGSYRHRRPRTGAPNGALSGVEVRPNARQQRGGSAA